MTLEKKRWPLHTALMWVLTRDVRLTDDCLPRVYWPHLLEDSFPPTSDVNTAWMILFAGMKGGSIPVFGRSTRDPNGKQKKLSASDLDGLDWANPGDFHSQNNVPGLRRRKAMRFKPEIEFSIPEGIAFVDVEVSPKAAQKVFPPTGKPIGFTSEEYGAPQRPVGPHYMSISSAAYWIANKGGSFSFFLRDSKKWATAYQDLLSQISGGAVEVIGRPQGKCFKEALDGVLFSSILIRVCIDNEQLVDASSNFPILDCAFPKTETKKQSPLYWESRRLEGDCLRVGDEIRFSELEVRQSDVHKIWFFSDSDAASRESDSIQGRKDPNKKKPKQAYDEWISGHEGKKPPSRDDDLMHMRELYPKIRRKTVRDFRTANKTASLHSLGRRPSVTTQAKINPAANLTK